MANIGSAIADAADTAENRGTSDENGTVTEVAAMATWPGVLDVADTDADESADNILTITVGGTQSDTVGDPDADPVAPGNAKMISGVPGFMNGFEMANDEQQRVIAFTDREQSVVAEAAVSEVTFVNAMVVQTAHITSLNPSTDGGQSWSGTYNDTTNGEVMGTFHCGESCSLVYTRTGDVVTVSSQPTSRSLDTGRARMLWKPMRTWTTSSSVSG